MIEQPYFDVFLAHNSQDKLEVKGIANQLKRRSLKVWIDEEQIRPGSLFQDVIQQAIPNVKSAAIFIGPTELGQWEKKELDLFNSRATKADIPVIPVLLPGTNKIPEHELFLNERNWVSFAKGIYDPDALYRLECGITGEKPTSPPNSSGHFDVWLCYNDEDQLEVEQIAKQLKEQNIEPWLDKWEVRSGMWEPLLAKQIQHKRIKTVAVFIGSSQGPWKRNEIDMFLWKFVRENCPIIPVFLRKVSQELELPIYLQNTTIVNFCQDNPDPIMRLIWGIPESWSFD